MNENTNENMNSDGSDTKIEQETIDNLKEEFGDYLDELKDSDNLEDVEIVKVLMKQGIHKALLDFKKKIKYQERMERGINNTVDIFLNLIIYIIYNII